VLDDVVADAREQPIEIGDVVEAVRAARDRDEGRAEPRKLSGSVVRELRERRVGLWVARSGPS
jgi:hypothetical protein